ncbi:MAG: hypothetical protein KC912_00130 [Proteobacteria bacterium]|nr:hypothetical protein [Pseudomonadota bacterium]
MFRIAVLLAVFAPSVSLACGMKRPPVQVAELTLADAFDAIDLDEAPAEKAADKPADANTANAAAADQAATDTKEEEATVDAEEPAEPAS